MLSLGFIMVSIRCSRGSKSAGDLKLMSERV